MKDRSPDTGASATAETCQAALAENLRPELFRALGDANRIAVVCRLADASRPLTVTEISGCCGVHISGVSRHLAQLRDAGVITAEKHGREVRYVLDNERLAKTLRGLADALEACRAQLCEGET